MTARLYGHLVCGCGAFAPSDDHFNRCRCCEEEVPFFTDAWQLSQLDTTPSGARGNPTSPDLVWGSADERSRRLPVRLAAVSHLTRTAGGRRSTGADVAGGSGQCLADLAAPFERFLHMDLSWQALAHAHKGHADREGIVYVQHDLRAAKPAVRGVDVAYAIDTLVYPGDFVPRTLASAARLHSPDGVLIAEFTSRFRSSVAHCVKGARWNGPRMTFSRRSARAVAQAAGLVVEGEFQLFKELPFSASLWLHRTGLAKPLAGLSTWFYLLLRRAR